MYIFKIAWSFYATFKNPHHAGAAYIPVSSNDLIRAKSEQSDLV